MNHDHKELIHDYLNLDRRLSTINQRMLQKDMEFNAQSFSGGTEFSLMGVRYRSFKVDQKVANHVDLMNSYERRLEATRRRQRYFDKFLKTLDPHTVASLNRRYRNASHFGDIQELGHDEIVLDEIIEIEEAVSFEFRTDLPSELKRDIIKVENTKFTEDTVEDSFQAMQSLLGVG